MTHSVIPASRRIYARPDIHAIEGYTPGEQPRLKRLVKLNTNENPYPPSPMVQTALAQLEWERLNRYPEPSARPVRETAARLFDVPMEMILCGNGSDDLLTIALRTFVGEGESFAFPEPSYSLYPVLAALQGARPCAIQLTEEFGLPEDMAAQAGNAKLLILARPNAPTGTHFPLAQIRRLAQEFAGVLWIDEAYVDFAEDSCLPLVKEFPNVVVSRTLSKSYALAGLRLGLAFAQPDLIAEMNKLKDSYNVDRIAQTVAVAALQDQDYLHETVAKIRRTRQETAEALGQLGCRVLPSQANFLLVEPPPAHPAAELFAALRQEGMLVRYFPLPRVSQFLRVTIGTPEEMRDFLSVLKKLLQ